MVRPKISTIYSKRQVDMYHRKHPNLSRESIREQVHAVIKKDFRDKTIANVVIDKGEYVLKKSSLAEFVNQHRDNVITPSGSVYVKSDVKLSPLSGFCSTRVSERDIAKQAGFVANQKGDTILALLKHFEQANKKLGINALPGSFNSKYNINTDQGNYNAVTSLGRACIKCSYTICEQFLGGNFHWRNDEDVVNYILMHIDQIPSEIEIMSLINEFGLKIPTHDEMINIARSMVNKYQLVVNIPMGEELIHSLSKTELIYIYYVNNFKNLVWENQDVFLPMLKDMFDLEKIVLDKSINPNELNSIDNDLLTMVCVVSYRTLRYTDKNGELKNRNLRDMSKYDPDGSRILIATARRFERTLSIFKRLVDILIDTGASVSDLQHKETMVREVNIGSDTDSIIFSCTHWITMYTGEEIKMTEEAYDIASFCIYWMSKILIPVLYKYSMLHGATEEKSGLMVMKNEFLMPLYIGFDVKKHYGSIITVVEGNVLINPKIDLKGLALKSSVYSPKTKALIEEIIVEDILKKGSEGRISAKVLIQKALDREHEIYNGLKKGEVTYMKSISCKLATDGDDWTSKSHSYARLWNALFSDYGYIEMPIKTNIVNLLPADPGYRNWLLENYPKVYKKLCDFMELLWSVSVKKKPTKEKAYWDKFPKKLAISAQYDKVPPEILPIIDIRNTIYDNMSPIYFVFSSLGINACPLPTGKQKRPSIKRMTLLMEQYPITPGKEKE
ncbi:MAG: hypothetical protein GY804_08575 [Alphaproteobacteria bacterium]|nr:hypothetical protein [Alphaproteobacteria bacterium]